MSIYAVKISGPTGWYRKGSAFETEIETLKAFMPDLKCHICGKPVTWEKGYVMHSITFGGPSEAYCSRKCAEGTY